MPCSASILTLSLPPPTESPDAPTTTTMTTTLQLPDLTPLPKATANALARIETITLRFDADESEFLEQNPLPVLLKLGIGSRMHAALRRAAAMRQIVGVTGPMGIGKSSRKAAALDWFQERETERAKRDSRYVPRQVLSLGNLRHDSYEGVLEWVLTKINAREPLKDRGRRKKPVELRERISVLLLQKNIRVVVFDECEALSEQALLAVRDVVADVAELERERNGPTNRGTALGVGALVIGSPEVEKTLRESSEFGQRIAVVYALPALTLQEATSALTTWLPVAAALTGDDAVSWKTFVRVTVCRERETTFRYLENLVRAYACTLDDARLLPTGSTWADVPIDLAVLTKIAEELPPPDLTGARAKVRRA